MNTLTASLCKKPVIGVAMWLMTFCASNQALHEKYVDLGNSGVLLSETFEAPMNERYRLIFLLHQSSSEDKAQDWPKNICATRSTSSEETLPISISARITNITKQSTVTYNFPIVCPRPHYEDSKSLGLGSMQLEVGKYRIEIVSGTALQSLRGKRVQALLRGEGAGFP